jgi:serine/threonine protein kinase
VSDAEKVAGAPTLAECLAHGPLPLKDALAIARQLVDALEAMHQKGRVHGALTPASIKVTPDGTVILLDVGREQAVDKQVDIWAFGAVLYEMLAGMPPLVQCEPDWNALPVSTPVPTRRLLIRCLEKDASRRIGDISQTRIDLGGLAEPAPAAAASVSASDWLARLRRRL